MAAWQILVVDDELPVRQVDGLDLAPERRAAGPSRLLITGKALPLYRVSGLGQGPDACIVKTLHIREAVPFFCSTPCTSQGHAPTLRSPAKRRSAASVRRIGAPLLRIAGGPVQIHAIPGLPLRPIAR